MEWYKQLAFQQESNDRRLMFYPEKRELFGTTGGYSMILHTERLDLRKLTAEDRADLNEILQDQDVMYAYEHAFSDDEVTDWLNRQLGRYQSDGFGLWAVVLRETGEMIGQAGLTIQAVSYTHLGADDCLHTACRAEHVPSHGFGGADL